MLVKAIKFEFNRLKLPVAIIVIGFLLIFGCYTTWRTHNSSTDFDTYYYAAKDALEDSSVYTEHEGVSPYIYPPFFACLIAPLAFFSMEVASAIWYILNLGFFFFSAILCFRLLFNKKNIKKILNSFPFAPKVLSLAVIIGLFLDNISMLQVNILVLLLVLSGLYCFNKRKAFLAGLFLAMAISIKVIPVLFLFYFIIKKKIKISIFIILWLLIFSLVVPALYMGPSDAWHSLLSWNESMLMKSMSADQNFDTIMTLFNPENQSVSAFSFRWLVKNDFGILGLKRGAHEYPVFLINWTLSLPKESAFFVSKIIVLLILSITFLWCLRKKENSSAGQNKEYALIFLASLIATPILKTQQMVLLIFPILLLLTQLEYRGKNYRFFYLGLACFTVLYLAQMGRAFKIFGFGTISILLLWFLTLKIPRHSTRTEP